MNSTLFYLNQFLPLAALSLLVSCAAVQSPPGGPKDETPPELVETIPGDGTINFKGGRVELVFSEFVDANSVQKAIHILPTLPEVPTLVYKGRKVFVEFPDSLSENQTYIVVIDRNLSDEHNITVAQGIQVAFATGDKIDQGSISGNVAHSKTASVHLWKIQNEEDLKDFYKRIPDYVIDAADEGDYEFRFLSQGRYKIAAVDQSASGSPISPERMVYGVPGVTYIQIESEGKKENIHIRIPERLGGIKMIQAEWIKGTWGRVTFSDDITEFADQIRLTIIQQDSSISKPIVFPDPLDESKLNFILDRFSEEYITVHTPGVIQGEDAVINSGLIRIKIDTTRDTTHVSIVSPDSKFILGVEADTTMPLQVVFSSLVGQKKDTQPFTLLEDSLVIPLDVKWESPIVASITPKENWKERTRYTLQISQDPIDPMYGRGLKDSVVTVSFKTADYQGFGMLIISCADTVSESLVAEITEMEKEPRSFRTVVNSKGIFNMKQIPEGNYSLSFFLDSDGSNTYSHGNIDPYQPSEWFYVYPDTVKIRTNWDLELDQIKLEQVQ